MNKTYLAEKILLGYILDKDIYLKEDKFYCNHIQDYAQYYYSNNRIYIIDFAGVRTYYNRFLWIWYNHRIIPEGYSVILRNNDYKDKSKNNIILTNKNPLVIGKEILASKKRKPEEPNPEVKIISRPDLEKENNEEHKKIITKVFSKNYEVSTSDKQYYLTRNGIARVLKRYFTLKDSKKSFSDDVIIKFRKIVSDVDETLFDDLVQIASSLCGKNKKIVTDILLGNTYTWLNDKTIDHINRFKKYYIRNYGK